MNKLPVVVAMAFLLGAIAIFLNQEKDKKIRLELTGSSYMEDVVITQRKDGMIKLSIASKKAVFSDDNTVKLEEMRVGFPDKDISLTSERGEYKIDKRDLRMEGRIVASTASYDIKADTLFWDAARNEVFSDTKVAIEGKNYHIEGDSLKATKDRATVNNNVKAVFYDK